MQIVYVLNRNVPFELIAKLLFESDLELTDVLSCTFPSRPEPKSACWKTSRGAKTIAYTYVPDVELRYLQICDRAWFGDRLTGAPITTWFAERTPVALFADWTELAADLNGTDYRSTVRAAHAFQVAAECGDSSVDAEQTLINALNSESAVTRNIAATALAEIATRDAETAIRARFDEESDSEVRFQLRRALDRTMSRL